jgi:hypothetical protein
VRDDRPFIDELFAIERAIAGSDEGGRRAAVIYTLIQTAKLNDVDPQAWLADVLARPLIIRRGGSRSCCPGNGVDRAGLPPDPGFAACHDAAHDSRGRHARPGTA